MFQLEPPERLALIQAKALQTRRNNKLKRQGISWAEAELDKVREHIADLNNDLKQADNAVDKLRIAQALSKLYEVAGLPKAGAYRPELKRETSKPKLGELE